MRGVGAPSFQPPRTRRPPPDAFAHFPRIGQISGQLCCVGQCGKLVGMDDVTPVTIPGARQVSSALHATALKHARQSIGRGEEGANNEGAYVRSLFTLFRHRVAGSWCAAQVSTWFVEAAKELRIGLPFQPAAGAIRLGKRIAQVGSWLPPESVPVAGDVAVWWRVSRASGKGHIGIVDYCHTRGLDTHFFTIEGNVGRYPAKVDIFHHITGEPRLLGFARL